MSSTNIINLNNEEFAVIDLDTGTVLGTNLVLVRIPEDETLQEDILSNDSIAWEYANENGIALTVTV